MLQMSKMVQSRNDWRKKAVERAEEIREYRKTIQRHKDTIAKLKSQLKRLEQALGIEETKKIEARG